MSSPLTMLKKTKRPPPQGSVNEPRCRPTVAYRKEPSSSQRTDVSSLNSTVSEASDFQSDDCQSLPGCTDLSSGDALPSDMELISAMMQQVIRLEKRVRSQEEDLRQKDRRISLLEEKLMDQEEADATRAENYKHDLEEKCQQLQDQVTEMENLLSDFGLVWLGDPDCSVEVKDFLMDFDLVLERVKELNVLAGEEQIFIQPTSTGAQLRRVDPIPLRLYSNGMILSNGPFRSYQDPSAQWCMMDIMEGYFPSELQERFPDGVPFEVYDYRDEEFNLDPLWLRFPGDGQTILGERHESAEPVCRYSLGRKSSTSWNILPKVMIRAGELFEIRDLVTANVMGCCGTCCDSQSIVETTALQSMRERLQAANSERSCPLLSEVTLKVRSEDGESMYLLKMSTTETVADIRRYLDMHRRDENLKYDIISVSPRRRYDDSCTLQSCGITSNFTLILRKRTSPMGLKQKESR